MEKEVTLTRIKRKRVKRLNHEEHEEYEGRAQKIKV
jgi:hypothetical protein